MVTSSHFISHFVIRATRHRQLATSWHTRSNKFRRTWEVENRRLLQIWLSIPLGQTTTDHIKNTTD